MHSPNHCWIHETWMIHHLAIFVLSLYRSYYSWHHRRASHALEQVVSLLQDSEGIMTFKHLTKAIQMPNFCLHNNMAIELAIWSNTYPATQVQWAVKKVFSGLLIITHGSYKVLVCPCLWVGRILRRVYVVIVALTIFGGCCSCIAWQAVVGGHIVNCKTVKGVSWLK